MYLLILVFGIIVCSTNLIVGIGEKIDSPIWYIYLVSILLLLVILFFIRLFYKNCKKREY